MFSHKRNYTTKDGLINPSITNKVEWSRQAVKNNIPTNGFLSSRLLFNDFLCFLWFNLWRKAFFFFVTSMSVISAGKYWSIPIQAIVSDLRQPFKSTLRESNSVLPSHAFTLRVFKLTRKQSSRRNRWSWNFYYHPVSYAWFRCCPFLPTRSRSGIPLQVRWYESSVSNNRKAISAGSNNRRRCTVIPSSTVIFAAQGMLDGISKPISVGRFLVSVINCLIQPELTSCLAVAF